MCFLYVFNCQRLSLDHSASPQHSLNITFYENVLESTGEGNTYRVLTKLRRKRNCNYSYC